MQVWVESSSLSLPNKEPTILTSAWSDLQIISSKPHPYSSHANDHVHDYIAAKVKKLASDKKYIEIDTDLDKGTPRRSIFDMHKHFDWVPHYVTYYESNNVVVKVQGSDPSLKALLVSAHYDSVPTSFGTTDDGMGVASMLGILEHVASTKQPLRTIIFNFNNNEEFSLFGAISFLKHPWYKLCEYFINLEGAGAGGRSILFRATDYGVAKYFSQARAPFGNSIFQQGFQSGLVKSETDYKIYSANGLRGIDIAFYKPRSWYHTTRDSVRSVQKGSLWHMLSNSLDYINAVAAEPDVETETSPAVFFDILNKWFVVLPLRRVYTLNIVGLVVVPVFQGLLLLAIVRKRTLSGKGWIRLPVSTAVGILLAYDYSRLIEFKNPYVVSDDWIAPMVAICSLFLLFNYGVLSLTDVYLPVDDQKLLGLMQIGALLWGLGIFTTTRQGTKGYVGEYFVMFFYYLCSLAVICGLIPLALKSANRTRVNEDLPSQQVQRGPPVHEGDHSDHESSVETHTATETSPLLEHQEEQEQEEQETEVPKLQKLTTVVSKSLNYDWSVQFLVMVPLWIFAAVDISSIALSALSQICQESDALGTATFHVVVMCALVLGMPLLPFIHKLNKFMGLLLGFAFLTSTMVSLLQYPFSETNPLKMRFLQHVDAQTGDNYVSILGKEGYVAPVVADLPCLKLSDESFKCTALGDGQENCQYPGERPWIIDEGKEDWFKELLEVEIVSNNKDKVDSPYVPLKAELKLHVKGSRVCDVRFNSTNTNSPVRQVVIHHNTAGNATVPDDEFKFLRGIEGVTMYKLDWTQPSFDIGLEWIPDYEDYNVQNGIKDLGVSVTCFYGEYEDSSAKADGSTVRKVPAFDELVQYSPSYVAYANQAKGMVAVERKLDL